MFVRRNTTNRAHFSLKFARAGATMAHPLACAMQRGCGGGGGGYNAHLSAWGYSSAGRALAWHARGQRFDPAYVHQAPGLKHPKARLLAGFQLTAVTFV